MNFKRHRFVRFQDWSSDNSSSPDQQISLEDGFYKRRSKEIVGFIVEGIRGALEKGAESVQSFKKLFTAHKPSERGLKGVEPRKEVHDPQGPFLEKWNKIFVFLCVIAVSLDPLFFYIPVIDGKEQCLSLDRTLEIIACVLRSFVDIFYILRIVFQFRTGFIAPPSRVFGRGELIKDPYAIAKRYLSSCFIVDILSILPLPQVVILFIIPMREGPVSLITKEMLKLVIFCQYVPRFWRIYPLYQEMKRTSGIFTETAWAGAAFNLFLYMLASHVVGALWYLFTVDRQDSCWHIACKKIKCEANGLYCGGRGEGNYSFLQTACPLLEPNEIKDPADFDFGIFLDGLQSGVVKTKHFWSKFLYCFWWGLRNLSSLGQNLKTSTFVWEILFAVFISILGLILFSLLIGNMQKYLQSITVRVEEMRVKRRDAELWMAHRMLPEELRGRIRRFEQYKWQENRGVEEDSLISNFPRDIKRDIKRHLCWALLTRVPMLEKMDDQLLDAMCDRLKPVLYTESSFIFREGDPVEEMIFIMRGTLLTVTTNGGRTGFFNSVSLKAGDFCGEELLTWALDPNSSSSLPTSTRTVKATTDVEAFALMSDDLKFVASQFHRLHSKQLRHTFRFYSQQWRAWAACFIQAAWRTHCRRKLEKALGEEEIRLQNALANEVDSSPSLGATVYASRFAANAMQNLPRNRRHSPKAPPRLPPLRVQKPSHPDFTPESQ